MDKEMVTFKEALLRYAQRTPDLMTAATSPVSLGLMAAHWSRVIDESRVPMQTIIEVTGTPLEEIEAFLGGKRSEGDMPEGFVDRLSRALGRQGALTLHIALFDCPEVA